MPVGVAAVGSVDYDLQRNPASTQNSKCMSMGCLSPQARQRKIVNVCTCVAGVTVGDCGSMTTSRSRLPPVTDCSRVVAIPVVVCVAAVDAGFYTTLFRELHYFVNCGQSRQVLALYRLFSKLGVCVSNEVLHAGKVGLRELGFAAYSF